MIEWDPVKITPPDRPWLDDDRIVRQWGVEAAQSFVAPQPDRADSPRPRSDTVLYATRPENISRRIRGFQFITKVGSADTPSFPTWPINTRTCDLASQDHSGRHQSPFVNGFIISSSRTRSGPGSLWARFHLRGYESDSFSPSCSGPFSEQRQPGLHRRRLPRSCDIAILERKGVDVTGRLLERVAAVFGQSRAQAAYRVGADIEATILAGQEVSQEQIESFLAEAVSKNAFPMLLNTKPIWWETHPLMKVLAQFKTWPIRQTNLIYQDVLEVYGQDRRPHAADRLPDRHAAGG